MLKLLYIILLSCFLGCSFAAATAEPLALPTDEFVVKAHDGNELPLYRYAAKGEFLLIWIGGSGWHDRTTRLAMEFAKKNIEVWQIDFAEALMQSSSSNFMRNMDARYVADVIDAAHKTTGKKVVLFTQAYGAVPLLRGATLWQERPVQHGKLAGAIMFSPDLVTGLPALGKDPEYLPIAHITNIPMIILQGGLRGSSMQFNRFLEMLHRHNPRVYFNVMPGISGMFYRDEPNAATLAKLKALPNEMQAFMKLLDATPYQIAKSGYTQPAKLATVALDIKLQPYKANPVPIPFKLKDVTGKVYSSGDFRGKVTVVNFWATWCPPCVEEIPSLNQLREDMRGKDFELISVNYAETGKAVNDFMKRVQVDFPVLLDPDGKTSQQWNVIGFPSTFVIGKNGKIQYGVNAAIKWDSPEVIETLSRMTKASD